MINKLKLSALMILLIILNSCGTSSEYTPVGTNCKKYNYSTFEMFLDIILGNNENENGDYDPNFEYKKCLKNEKLKIDKQNNTNEEEKFKKLKEEMIKNNAKQYKDFKQYSQ